VNGEVLLIGATGLLGSDVLVELQSRGWNVDAPNRTVLDLEDPRSIDAYFLAARPAWVINCAAYTAVDAAESDESRANVLNSVVPFSLARFCKWIKARLLHISTDFVFDGESKSPYKETDEAHPLGTYAKSKLHGERLALDENKEMIVARTAWLFGSNGKCFPRTILKAALEGKELRVVSDQFGCPSYTKDIAKALCNLVASDAVPGIYHVANRGQASWYELACETIRDAGIESEVQPISTEDWPTPAPRPKFSVLDTSKYESLGFEPMPEWQTGVQRFVEEVLPMLKLETARQ
jgi:dTDP-4-dehydrorhamnose reductase